MGVPFAVFVPTGILSTSKRYILPLLVNIINESIVFVLITQEVISSCVFTPFVLRLCVRKEVLGILLIRPPSVITTTHFSGSTNSISFSSLVESAICVNSVLRSSPYVATKDLSLFTNSSVGLLKIKVKSSISDNKASLLFCNSILSRPAKRPSFISTIAFACGSVKLYCLISSSFAAAAEADFLIKAIILSISSKAFNKPSTTSNFSWHFFKSNSVSRLIHSVLCSTQILTQSLRFNSTGVLSTRAT